MALGAFVRLIPKAGAEAELIARALDVAADVRTEPGNILTLVMRDPERSGDVLMLEVFRDEAAIEAHKVARHSVEKGPFVHALLETPMQVQRLEVVSSA